MSKIMVVIMIMGIESGLNFFLSSMLSIVKLKKKKHLPQSLLVRREVKFHL